MWIWNWHFHNHHLRQERACPLNLVQSSSFFCLLIFTLENQPLNLLFLYTHQGMIILVSSHFIASLFSFFSLHSWADDFSVWKNLFLMVWKFLHSHCLPKESFKPCGACQRNRRWKLARFRNNCSRFCERLPPCTILDSLLN